MIETYAAIILAIPFMMGRKKEEIYTVIPAANTFFIVYHSTEIMFIRARIKLYKWRKSSIHDEHGNGLPLNLRVHKIIYNFPIGYINILL